MYFFAVLIGVFILYIIGFWAVHYYERWQTSREMAKLAAELKQQEDARQAAIATDTYGGKTPQETLQMYISAVEKGDYELASKYFVLENQEKELKKLQNSSYSQLLQYLSFLNQTLNSPGSFSADRKGYAVTKPVLVDFELYPSGIWKIIQI